MAASTVGKTYAEGLSLAAETQGEPGAVETIGEQLEAFANAVARDGRFRRFLDSPAIAQAEKRRVLESALSGKLHPFLLNFLRVLLRKRRQRALAKIAAEYRRLLDAHQGVARGELRSAVAVDASARARLSAALSEHLARKVVLAERVEPALLGGCAVQVGDRVLDGTFRSRLTALRRRMLSTAAS